MDGEAKTAAASKDHLVDLADGWSLWRSVALRGAGFPVHLLEAIVASKTAALVDRFLDREADFEELRGRALQICNAATASLDREARKPYRRATRLLAKGRVPVSIAGSEELSELLSTLSQTAEVRDGARIAVGGALGEDGRLISDRLLEICREPRFREALIWQNRHALGESVDVLARMDPEARNKVRRKHEQLVFNYVQRYCAKNDTISFFGPAVWVAFNDSGPPVAMRPGPKLCSSRQAYFEFWAIDSLAVALGKEKELLPWLAPRLNPNLRISDDWRLQHLGTKPVSLSAQEVRLLAACDGENRAIDIANRFGSGSTGEFASPARVYQALIDLARAGVILWNAYVPVTPDADQALLKLLERIGDPALRQRYVAKLAALQDGRAKVEAARGDPVAMNSAMAALEDTFKQLTGREATRRAGEMYGGRTLIYEDCRRDLELTLGPEIRHRIGPGMALVLRGANWYLHRIGARFTQFLNDLYTQFRDRAGGSPVSFEAMVYRNRDVWRAGPVIIAEAVKAHQQRWQSVLSFDPDEKHVRFAAAELREAVFSAFPEVPLQWPVAKYHSPDLMFAAESVEAIEQGQYLPVLGEFNAGVNRLGLPTLSKLHPDPSSIARFLDEDLGRPRVLQVFDRRARGHRVVFDTTSPLDFHLAANDTPSWRAKEQVLPVSELVVERLDQGLIVQTRDGTRRFHIADVFSLILGRHYWEQISMLPSVAHLPRLSFDDLVVSREKWRMPCGDVTFAHERTTEERFIAARRFMRGRGLPRWMFLRVPYERKPLYLDFESPLAVDALAKVIRRGAEEDPPAEATFSEMLPTPEQCWLTDAEGNRYTSEFRLAVVNPETWQPKRTQGEDA